MSKRKKAIMYIVILILIFSGVFFYANRKRDNSVSVKTTIAEIGNIKSYLSTTATIESQNSQRYFGIQAKVDAVAVSEGSVVKKGQLLVSYDIKDIETAVKQAKIQYDNALLQRDDLYKQNKSIKDKIKELEQEIDSYEQSTALEDKAKLETYKQQRNAISEISAEKLKLADNSVALAKLAYSSASQRLKDNNGKLYAKAAGVVTAVNVEQGTVASMMQPAVEVMDVENLKAVVALGKYDANKVRVGQTVIIKNGDQAYKGIVSEIGAVASKGMPQAGNDASLEVQIKVIDKNTNLKIAFDVDVDILTGQKEQVLVVPAECIKPEKEGRNLVYVLEGKVVHEKVVKLGLRSDTLTEIKEGVKAGDKLVLNPSTSIVDGVKVKEE